MVMNRMISLMDLSTHDTFILSRDDPMRNMANVTPSLVRRDDRKVRSDLVLHFPGYTQQSRPARYDLRLVKFKYCGSRFFNFGSA